MSAKKKTDADKFVPGSYGCHEALHMAGYLANTVEAELCEHAAIMANADWLRRAEAAALALAELYQEIGNAHLASPQQPNPEK